MVDTEQPGLPPFDYDAIYNCDQGQLGDPCPEAGPEPVDLYAEQEERGGHVRAQSTYSDETGPLNYQYSRPDYTINLERLVWLDGSDPVAQGGGGGGGGGATQGEDKNLSLVVLKLDFGPGNGRTNTKIRFAQMELRFQADKRGGRDPKVVAWGPFRHRQTWNPAVAKINKNAGGEISFTAGAYGQGATLKGTRNKEVSWEQGHHDQGSSTYVLNKKGATHGVRWGLSENTLFGEGVKPELTIGVLISRPKPTEDYRATFRLFVHTRDHDESVTLAYALLGMGRGKEQRWCRTPQPGVKEGCHWGDGASIVERIDPDNLGALASDPLDRTKLNLGWMEGWDDDDDDNLGEQPKSDSPAASRVQQLLAQQQQENDMEKQAEEVQPAAVEVEAVVDIGPAQVEAQVEARWQQPENLITNDDDASVGVEEEQHARGQPPVFPHPAAAVEQDPPPITVTLPMQAAASQPPEPESSTPATYQTRIQDDPGPELPNNSSSSSRSSAFTNTNTTSTFIAANPTPRLDQPLLLNVDSQGYQRLVSLEARAAHAEARIGALESLLFQLQHRLA